MDKRSKIYVAGHRGLVGSALVRALNLEGFTNIVTRNHAELDLTQQSTVDTFFSQEKPDYVFLAAAKVGGIHANEAYPAEFIYENLTIQNHVIHNAWKHGVKRLLFLGSSCIYPKFAPQPMPERCLMSAALEPSNRPYAMAKIAGIELCDSFNRQYGTKFLAAMPTNLYGPGDNYHATNSHVIPALIRRFCEAVENASPTVTLWGTGTARREFLHSDDLANACLFLMNLTDDQYTSLLGHYSRDIDACVPPLINIGIGSDITIETLAELIAEITHFQGTITYDTTKPDGTPRKLLDVSKISALGWKPNISLREGLTRAVDEFKANEQLRR